MTTVLIFAALAIAAVTAVYFLGRWFDTWLGRQMDFDLSEPETDVIDAWALTPLSDSPIFLQTVADLPVAGEMAARFAAEVEQYVREAS